MGKDYYQILGVTRNARASEVSSAYQKKALKFHPGMGRNKCDSCRIEANRRLDEQEFKELTEAYEVLSNAQKRQVYDKLGEEGLKERPFSQAKPPEPPSAEEIFKSIFRGIGLFDFIPLEMIGCELKYMVQELERERKIHPLFEI
jgi:DnaJ-class molecular chaperone